MVAVGLEDLGAKEFMDGGFWQGELFIDQKHTTYQALGFKRFSMLSILKAALSAKSRATLSRANEKKIKGNMKGEALQIGGTLLLSKGGDPVLLHFKQEGPGDHIALQTVLDTFGLSGDAPAQPAGAEGVVCNEDVCKAI